MKSLIDEVLDESANLQHQQNSTSNIEEAPLLEEKEITCEKDEEGGPCKEESKEESGENLFDLKEEVDKVLTDEEFDYAKSLII